MKAIQIIFITFLMLLGQSLRSQEYIIEGLVSGADTGETLPFANVFIANTTYGTVTNNEGAYNLKLPAAGTYEIVVSFLGYETYARVVNFEEPGTIEMNAQLAVKSRQLSSVTITAKKDEEWKRNLEEFKKGFLGESRLALNCKILNEESLNFERDPETGVFEAYSGEPLIIENKVLGYKVTYLLEEYKLYTRQGFVTFYGYSSYEEMETKNKRRQKKYEEERKKAYLGSIQHFFASLYAGNVKEEGFDVYLAKNVGNFGRAIERKRVKLKNIVFEGDSEQTKKLIFDDYLYIYYNGEYEPREYHDYMSGVFDRTFDSKKPQNTWLLLREGAEFVEFESNGYIRNPLSFFSDGYLGFEKIGDLIPINYKIEDN